MTESVATAVAALAAGQMILVVDDESRENEGDLFIAAQHTNAESIAFMLHHTSGFICVATTGEICDRLELPQMVQDNREAHRTAFTVTVDLSDSTTTGISAGDRAATIRAVADSLTQPAQLLRPGHVHVLRAADEGLNARRGHTEAAVELAARAGLVPAVTICELVSNDKLRMASGSEVRDFATQHGLPLVSVAEIAMSMTSLDLLGDRADGQTAGHTRA